MPEAEPAPAARLHPTGRGRRSTLLVVAAVVAMIAPSCAEPGTWRPEPIPVSEEPDVRSVIPRGVSCPSATQCVMVSLVDGADDGYRSLATHWDGSAFTDDTRTVDWDDLIVDDVDCASASLCFAVGRSRSPGGDVPTIRRWDGVAWSTEHLSGLGLEQHRESIQAIACAGPAFCMAAHPYFTLTWDGTTWRRHDVRSPLGSLRCSSATRCASMNRAWQTEHGFITFELQVWDGTGWTVTTPWTTPPTPTSAFRSFDCADATTCFVSGLTAAPADAPTGLVPILWRLGATGWSVEAVGDGWTDAEIISCPSATSCVTSGPTGGAAWDGTSWTVQPGRRTPPELREPHLDCVPGWCLLVGTTTNAGGGHARAAWSLTW